MASLARTVVKGSALGLLGTLLALPVALVSTPLFLKGLGATGFGYWGLLQGFFAALSLLAVGTTEATLYFVARDEAQVGGPAERSRNRALVLVVLAGCLTGGLVLALGPCFGLGSLLDLPLAEQAGFERLLLPAAAFWCCQFWFFWLQLLPRARHEYGVLAWNQIALAVLVPLLGWVGMVLGHGDVRTFLWGQALAWALGSLSIHTWNARHKQPLDLRPGFDPEVLAEVGRYARWALVFNLAIVVLNSSDRLLLAKLGVGALAGYTAASSFTMRVYAVTGSMSSSLLPALARIKEGIETDRLRRGFSVSLRAIGFFWAALLLPLAAWGDHFMAVWLRDPAMAAATYPALRLLCCGAFFGALASGCHAALLGTGRPRLAAVTGMAGAVVGLLIALVAIPRFGIAGAALLGLAGNALAYLMRVVYMEKTLFSRPLSPLILEQVLACAALGLAYAAMRLVSPALEGEGLVLTALIMVGSAGLLLLLGLGLDWLCSALRSRPSLWSTVLALKRAGEA
ncbi:MAG TPA: lipopolysaccharide biosynthesis protein [bacterium]|jgi:O-antigen/teichoic acid export membrane protein|nr:lipopolysaccharide biosynthesis protein [bacterium]